MRSNPVLTLAGLAGLALFASCGANDASDAENATAKMAPTDPPPQPGADGMIAGNVVETMNASSYTYVKVDTGSKQEWYAGPAIEVAVGDRVVLPANVTPMQNFESATLGRTFESIFFVNGIRKVGTEPGFENVVQQAHAGAAAMAKAPEMDFTGIEKPEGGMTVAEIFAAGADAAGNEVVLRGKVVKINLAILGKNWLHVRDGSGEEGTNDITITTPDAAKVGDTVVVRGKLAANRDFGMGYKYDLLIEDAKITVE